MLLYGASSFDPSSSPQDAIKVGEHTVSQAQVEEEIGQNLESYLTLYGFNAVDPSPQLRQLVATQVRKAFIRELVMVNLAEDAGLVPSDDEIENSIRNTEAFIVDGRFSPSRFNALVQDPADYVRRVSLRVSSGRIKDAFVVAAITPPSLADMMARYQRERRKVRKLVIPVDVANSDVSVSEDDARNYYNANSDLYVRPERLRLEYVLVDAASVADQVVVDEDVLRAAHVERIAQAAINEERQLSLVELETKSAAEATLAEINGGADFATIARKRSIDEGSREVDGDLGFVTRADLDPAVADAVFVAAVGDVLGPFDSGDSWLLFRVAGKIGGAIPDYDEVREELAEQVRLEQVGYKLNEVATELENLALELVGDLAPVEEQLGLDVRTTDWIEADSTPVSVPAPFNEGYLLAEAFSEGLRQTGQISTLLRKDDGSYVIMRVLEYDPKELLELAEVQDKVYADVKRHLVLLGLSEDLNAKMQQLVAGEQVPSLDFEAVEVTEVDRLASKEELGAAGISPQELQELFSGKVVPSKKGLPAYYFHFSGKEGGFVFFRIDEIVPGGGGDENLRALLANNLGANDANLMLSGYLAELGKGVNVSITDDGKIAGTEAGGDGT